MPIKVSCTSSCFTYNVYPGDHDKIASNDYGTGRVLDHCHHDHSLASSGLLYPDRYVPNSTDRWFTLCLCRVFCSLNLFASSISAPSGARAKEALSTTLNWMSSTTEEREINQCSFSFYLSVRRGLANKKFLTVVCRISIQYV